MEKAELPSVSVILPVKNGALYLVESLRSVIEQDYPPLEILLFDNASTDATPEIARTFSEVRYLRNDPELSIAATRNAGIRMARGALIGFASHDDLWSPNKLRLQAECFQRDPKLEFCVAHVRCFLDAEIDSAPAGLPNERIERDLPGWLTETLVARRRAFDLIGYFDESLRQTDDTDWLVRAQDLGVPLKMLEETLVRKRIHGGNITYRSDTRAQGAREMLEIARRAIERKR
jgi:glycosyltransferase involved in cell wall biosynthesis